MFYARSTMCYYQHVSEQYAFLLLASFFVIMLIGHSMKHIWFQFQFAVIWWKKQSLASDRDVILQCAVFYMQILSCIRWAKFIPHAYSVGTCIYSVKFSASCTVPVWYKCSIHPLRQAENGMTRSSAQHLTREYWILCWL